MNAMWIWRSVKWVVIGKAGGDGQLLLPKMFCVKHQNMPKYKKFIGREDLLQQTQEKQDWALELGDWPIGILAHPKVLR